MLEPSRGCDTFRDTLNRSLDGDTELVDEAAFVSHIGGCVPCRRALQHYNRHIQAHRILAAGGRMDAHSVASLSQNLPHEFGFISDRLVRKRAKSLGTLKFRILQVYLKHVLSEHAWPPVLDEAALSEAQAASENLIDNLERYKESDVIFAEGGPVDLSGVRTALEKPLDGSGEGLEPQLQMIARGLLTARTLNPGLDEYILHLLGVILERLGFYAQARDMFLALARRTPDLRDHLRARALNSAGRTAFRHLGAFQQALAYLSEAEALFPGRWTVEYNLASWYVWPTNPERDPARAAPYFEAFAAHIQDVDRFENLLGQDITVRLLFEEAGFLPLS